MSGSSGSPRLSRTSPPSRIPPNIVQVLKTYYSLFTDPPSPLSTLSPYTPNPLTISVPLCPQTIEPTDLLITFSALNPLTPPNPVRNQHILPHHSLCPLTPQFLYLPVALPPLNLHPPLHHHSIFLRPQSLYSSRNTQSLNHPLPPFS